MQVGEMRAGLAALEAERAILRAFARRETAFSEEQAEEDAAQHRKRLTRSENCESDD